MKTVLVALDLPVSAGPTLDTSIALARGLGARLVTLHIVRPSAITSNEITTPSEHVALQLTRLQRRLRKRGVTIETRHVVGQPGRRIVELASLLAATYVVVGAHDRGPLPSGFLGGTTTQVLRDAPCPVVVVPPAPPARTTSPRGRTA